MAHEFGHGHIFPVRHVEALLGCAWHGALVGAAAQASACCQVIGDS